MTPPRVHEPLPPRRQLAASGAREQLSRPLLFVVVVVRRDEVQDRDDEGEDPCQRLVGQRGQVRICRPRQRYVICTPF